MLTRRQFIGLSGGAAVTGAAAWAGLLRDHASSHGTSTGSTSASGGAGTSAAGADGNVLVVVQMSGGNDALNTVIPHDGHYHDLRPQLGIPDGKLVALNGEPTVGLHPSLQPLLPLWAAGQLAILPDVGFAADSRSHFESLAAWWTASPEHRVSTGWIGRWLDATGIAKDNPLAAISLGGGAVPALTSDHSQSTAVNDLAGFRLMAPPGSDGARLAQAFAATASPANTDDLSAQAQSSVGAALHAVDVLSKANAGSDTPVEGDNSDDATAGPIAAGLAAAADLIELDLGTRVLLVSASGFDTHANQADTQQRLLADLATGMSSFFTTLQQKGHAERVLLLTTSEFGRRASENGSGGTDHGHGGVHFLAGPSVHGGLHGSVDVGHLADGDLPAAVDTRSMYAAALDWLGGPSSDLLDGHADDLHLLNA
ncbi:MAG TPA: DUF1501 domain-containing protein [Acidimicrobiales bacterium]|jgi:uncharacterized protein (DUF1501 family)